VRIRGRREPSEASQASAPDEGARPASTLERDRGEGHEPVARERVRGGARANAAGEPAPVSRRRAFAGRSRNAGAAAVGTAGAGVLMIARLVMGIASLIALLIALAIVLRDADANSANSIVKGIHEGANFFAGAFTGLIRFSGHPKRAITVDWGIALVVYLIVGSIVSSLIARIGRGGMRFERAHRTVPSH
jgi:hypothetical protein